MDEMTPQPHHPPAMCINEHMTWSGDVYLGAGRVTYREDQWCEPCPACGGQRVIPVGTYELGEDRMVRRIIP